MTLNWMNSHEKFAIYPVKIAVDNKFIRSDRIFYRISKQYVKKVEGWQREFLSLPTKSLLQSLQIDFTFKA